jgi:OOP family OmpA-OmpF porin
MSQIDELRHLIVGANEEQLAALKERIENIEQRTLDVAEVITPALNEGLKRDGQSLVSALKDPVTIGLKQAIRAEPDEFADILYPAMAPSIRRIISQSISSLLVTINRTVESATSAEGIRTRIQSIRTGIPYAELALRQSLLYRVEHVYLIDRASGIKIDDAASDQSTSLDSDAVSAMFSAIQSFVQDSFSQDKTAMLTDLKVGEYNVWVAHGPSLMLACVINGDAPEGLKDDLYDALYRIRTSYANQIAEFDGSADSFDGVQEIMQPLLQLELKDGQGNQDGVSKSASFLPMLLLFALIAGVGYYLFDRNSKIDTVEYFLRQTPGIASTDIFWENGSIVVEGLQDPDAKIPYDVFTAYGIKPGSIVLQTIPFRSLDVNMELQRFRDEFVLPKGVNLASINNAVHLDGRAPITWLNTHDIRIRQLAADSRLNISELTASPESVKALLRKFLSQAEVDALNVFTVDVNFSQITRVNGSLPLSKVALVKALFANNIWVEVALSSSRKVTINPN